jgi:hypothetical protein
MEQIHQLLAASDATSEQILAIDTAIRNYGNERWVAGWNRALEVSGHGTPPEPQIRTELRNNLKPTGI